jgi:Tetratricopeptide repeat
VVTRSTPTTSRAPPTPPRHETRFDRTAAPDHPLTAQGFNNLAGVLHAQGDLHHARTLHERALSIREAHQGPDHPDTVRSRENLAAVLTGLENRRQPVNVLRLGCAV